MFGARLHSWLHHFHQNKQWHFNGRLFSHNFFIAISCCSAVQSLKFFASTGYVSDEIVRGTLENNGFLCLCVPRRIWKDTKNTGWNEIEENGKSSKRNKAPEQILPTIYRKLKWLLLFSYSYNSRAKATYCCCKYYFYTRIFEKK